MKIAVRLDDITPDMDWQRFFRFKALLDQYQVKPLIGVVPDNRDENLRGSSESRKDAPADFYAYIRGLQEEGWSVALHGMNHVYSTKKGGLFPLNDFSEYAGKPYEEQKEMIARGKQILEEHDVHTDLFMAPAHSYDRNTLRALKENGFQALTDGFGEQPYLWQGLTFYPISFRLSDTLKKKKGYSTMVVHTGTIQENELAGYEKRFQAEGVTWISYEEYRKVPAVKRGLSGRIREYLMARAKFLLVRLHH